MADLNPSNNVLSATYAKTGVGTTELPAVFIKNPSGSGKTANLISITIANVHTVSSWIRVRVYANPTTSADGTAINRSTLDVGSGKTATCTAFQTPTVSVNGTRLFDFAVMWGTSFTYFFPPGTNLQANNTILCTAVADGSSRIAAITLVWDED